MKLVYPYLIFVITWVLFFLIFRFYFFFFFLHKKQRLYRFSVIFSSVVTYHRAFGITQSMILMFLFMGYAKSLLKYFQVLLLDGFRKSNLSTTLLIHKVIWFLFSPISRILNYHNIDYLLPYSIVMLISSEEFKKK